MHTGETRRPILETLWGIKNPDQLLFSGMPPFEKFMDKLQGRDKVWVDPLHIELHQDAKDL